MKKTKLVITLAVIVVASSILVYILNFTGQEISNDTSKWGAFSDYLNPFVAIANLIVFIWLSIEVFNYNKKKDAQTDTFEQTIQKPVLIFKSLPPKERNSRELWIIKNIGNGAALNLRIAESRFRNIDWVTPITKCYSLGSGDFLELKWLKHANVICVTYEDVFTHRYVTIGADDESQTRELKEPFKLIEIKDKEFNLNDIKDFLKLDTQRLHAAELSVNLTSSTTPNSTSPQG